MSEVRTITTATTPEVGSIEWIERYFPVVKAGHLSLDSDILVWNPQTESQKLFMILLKRAINSGLTDFRAQVMDPSIEEGKIIYKPGKSYVPYNHANWWFKNAIKVLPEKNSRMGLTKQRIGFLGCLMEELIKERGLTVKEVWSAICDDSKDLGHFLDSYDARYTFEKTGKRQVCRWYDLGNTCKITADDSNGKSFSLFDSCYRHAGSTYPLLDHGDYQQRLDSDYMDIHHWGVGWIICDV